MKRALIVLLALAGPALAEAPTLPQYRLRFDCANPECSAVLVPVETIAAIMEVNHTLAEENLELKKRLLATPPKCGTLDVVPNAHRITWKRT